MRVRRSAGNQNRSINSSELVETYIFGYEFQAALLVILFDQLMLLWCCGGQVVFFWRYGFTSTDRIEYLCQSLILSLC